eukprot:6006564-Alexandrium_andersonii.AAC.1
METREVGPEVDQARGLDGVRPVLALIEVDHADARAQGGAMVSRRLGVLYGEADPEVRAEQGQPNALQRGVCAEAELLVFRGR